MDEKKHRSPEETSSFGQELRREREVRDVTLAEISAATKISARILSALENDQFESLPAPVFTKGFIREFSRYLGLDPEKMVNSYVYHRQLREAESTHVRTQRENEERAVGSMRRNAQLRSIAGGAVLLAVAISLIWFAVSAFRSRKSGPKGASSAASAALPPPPPVSSAAPPATATRAGEVVLTLRFEADCWMSLDIDGKPAVSELFHAGTTREFRGTSGFVVTVGNAGGVRASVNGRDLGPLGAAGEVVKGLRIGATGIVP